MIFSPDGSLVRTARLGPQPRPDAVDPAYGRAPSAPAPGPAFLPRGPRLPNVRTLVGTDMVIGTGFPPRAPAPASPAAAPVRVPYPVMRMSLRTLRTDTVVTLMPVQLPRTPLNPQSNGGNLTIFVSTSPLQSVDAWAAFSDGTVAVVRAASYRVEWFPLVGERFFTDAVPHPSIPVTKDDKKRVVDEYKRVGEQVLSNHPMRSQILAVTYEEPLTWPTTHPPFRGDIAAMVDPQDRMWLRTRCVTEEQAVCYDVIDRTGARAERYRLPPKTRVVGFGPGVVYTTFEQKGDKDSPAAPSSHLTTMSTTMRGLTIDAHGGLEQLRVRTTCRSRPSSDRTTCGSASARRPSIASTGGC